MSTYEFKLTPARRALDKFAALHRELGDVDLFLVDARAGGNTVYVTLDAPTLTDAARYIYGATSRARVPISMVEVL